MQSPLLRSTLPVIGKTSRTDRAISQASGLRTMRTLKTTISWWCLVWCCTHVLLQARTRGICPQAKIVHSVIAFDDRMLIPMAGAFGFAAGGKLEITISNIAIYQQHTPQAESDYANMGFFLSPKDDTALEAGLANDTCILNQIERNSLPLFTDSLIQKVIRGEAAVATYDFTLENGGEWGQQPKRLREADLGACRPLLPVLFQLREGHARLVRHAHRGWCRLRASSRVSESRVGGL